MRRWVVGIDVGGTFTDFCAWDGQSLRRAKTLTTPDDLTRGVAEGVAMLGVEADFVLVAGSTVATNTLLERSGARVAYVGTRGFEDVPLIGRQNRPKLYDLHVRKPRALVDSSDCFGVAERVGPGGEVIATLDEASVREVIAAIRGRGIESVAVCLLFSFLNSAHEERIAAIAGEAGLSVHCSSRILPEFREFERAATTIVNAYVAPRTGAFLAKLAETARGAGAADVRVMQSNGGQASPAEMAAQPVRTILSGPAGGAIAAAHAAKLVGVRRALTYDMGGTSTDVALCDGDVAQTSETVIDGWPVRVSQLAIHTVGQGGGSIASVDAGGALQVGPRSAGAVPGPACYGRGDEATVTDANLVLGRLVADHFLGGRMRLDVDRATRVVERIGAQLGCSSAEAAGAIVAVANAGMEHALHVVSSRRGIDPGECWLVSFGGAGGLHAAALAEAMNLRGVIVPPDPGILSATGMVLADVVKDYSLSLARNDAGIDLPSLRTTFGLLMDRAAEGLFRDGFDLDDAECERMIDLRYRGQAYELTVPVESLTDVSRLAGPFHRAHRERYGTADEALPVEAVTARVRAVVRTEKMRPVALVEAGGRAAEAIRRESIVFDRAMSAGVFERGGLLAGHVIEGPAVVVEAHATTLVPPGWSARVEAMGHLRMTRGTT